MDEQINEMEDRRLDGWMNGTIDDGLMDETLYRGTDGLMDI